MHRVTQTRADTATDLVHGNDNYSSHPGVSDSVTVVAYLPPSEAVAVLELSVCEGASGGHGFGLGHSVGTTTGLLLRTILRKSLVLMPRVKLVEKTQNMHAKESTV